MTLYTHSIVGLGLGALFAGRRMPWLFWTLAAILPVLPDLDVFSSRRYGTILGHRGFTHSFIFAAGVGLVVAAGTFRYFGKRFLGLAGLFALMVASHGILDAFTRGGEGIPFFWPLSEQRFGGWGPVPLPDIAFEFPDVTKSRALRGELFWVWLPLGLVVGGVTGYRMFQRNAFHHRDTENTEKKQRNGKYNS